MRNKNFNIVIFILCLVTHMVASAGPDAAEQAHSTERQLNDLRSKISLVSEQLRKDSSAAGGLQKELRKIEQDQQHISIQLRHNQHQQAKMNKRLVQMNNELDGARAALGEKRESVKQLFRSIYILDQKEPIKLALNQGSVEHLDRHLYYLSLVQHRQVDQVRALTDATRTVLEKTREIDEERSSLAHAEEAFRDQQIKLAARSVERDNLLKKLQESIASRQARLDEMRGNEARLTQLLTDLNKVLNDVTSAQQFTVKFSALKGKLGWPIKGPVVGAYGTYLMDGQVRRNGMLIGANQGDPVRAISHGRVVFADWLRGYGLLTIIDHGNGYMSLYGHNEALYRDVGEWVSSGDILATVGNTGGQADMALYFEIRAKGVPVNPRSWCCAKK